MDVEYDGKNRLAIALTIFSRKIGEVWKMVKISYSDMDDIEKSDFFKIVDPQWFNKLEGFVDSNT